MSKKKPEVGGAARKRDGRGGRDGGGGGNRAAQAPPPEQVYAAELDFLARWDDGPRPPSWKLTPRAVGDVHRRLRRRGAARRRHGAW